MSDKPPEKMTVEELLTAIGYRVADLRFEANLHSKTALVTADADDPQPGDGRTWDIVWEVDYERKVYGRAVNRDLRQALLDIMAQLDDKEAAE